MSVVSDTVGRPGSLASASGCGCSASSGGSAALSMQLADLLVEVAEEVVGHFPGGGVDQARADLRELAADARLDVVGKAGGLAFRCEAHVSAALREPGGSALAFEGYGVRVGRLHIR